RHTPIVPAPFPECPCGHRAWSPSPAVGRRCSERSRTWHDVTGTRCRCCAGYPRTGCVSRSRQRKRERASTDSVPRGTEEVPASVRWESRGNGGATGGSWFPLDLRQVHIVIARGSHHRPDHRLGSLVAEQADMAIDEQELNPGGIRRAPVVGKPLAKVIGI